MQVIFDHLIAITISAVLAMILMSQQLASRQDSLERQSVYDAKTKALAFAEWLEDDIVKLGARFGQDRDRFTFETDTLDGAEFTTRFEYYYNERTNDDGTTQRVEVRYQLANTDSMLVATGATASDSIYVQLYEVARSTRAGQARDGDWVSDVPPTWEISEGYRTPYGLSYFQIEPRNSQGIPVTDPTEADYVRLQFSVVPSMFPVHRARMISGAGLNWATTVEIRPF
jgi:hypothetical protein